MSSKINNTNVSSEENKRMENAHRVAAIVKNSNLPILKCPSSGSKKYFKSVTEKERARLLNNPEEMNSARVHGKSVAQLLKKAPRFEYQERPTYKGYWRFLSMLEEKERQRRINDRDESVHRRMNALNISDGIRTQGTIVRARLMKRAPKAVAPAHTTWENLSAAAHLASIVTNKAIHDAVEIATPAAEVAAHALANAYESARNAVTSVPAMANKAVHNAVDAITPHPEPNAPSAISSLLNRAFSIKDSLLSTVQHAIGSQPAGSISGALSNISMLEEMERERRIQEDPINGCARSNARKMSQLLSHAGFRSLSSGKGYKRFTNAAEERERLRRLANKSECESHRLNANKVAGMVSQLGWPFIREAGSRSLSATQSLEEEERKRRMNDENGQWSARYNSKKVAGLIKDASFPEQSKKAFMLAHTRKLEEKERKYRLKNCDRAVHNAHRQAQLIVDVGSPFYTTKARADVKEIVRQKIDRMETEERLDRMHNAPQQQHAQKKAHKIAALIANRDKQVPKSKLERQMAQEFAHDVAHIQSTDLSMLEENERKARMSDKLMQQQARANANKVAGLMQKTFVKNNTNSGFGLTANKPFPLSSMAPATISPPSTQLSPYTREALAAPSRGIAPAQTIAPPVIPAKPQTAKISQPTPAQHASFTPAIPYTQVQYKPTTAPLLTPVSTATSKPTTVSPTTSLPFSQRFNLKKSEPQSTPASSDVDLFSSVRNLYNSESMKAEKEQEKINKLSGKSHGPFGRYRLQRHEANLTKARDNARRHEEWLRTNAPAASSAR